MTNLLAPRNRALADEASFSAATVRATPAGLHGVACVFEVSGAVEPARSVLERVAWNHASWFGERRRRCTRFTSSPGVVDLLHASVET